MTIDRIVADLTAAWTGGDAAGGVIALFDRGGIRRSWCLGLADLESRRPWTVDTPTRLASISKHVLSVATMRLGIEGEIGRSLHDLHPTLAAVPVARALTMTSGIPDLAETLALSGIPATAALDAERLYGLCRRLDHLNFPCGSQVSYSNTNYRLLQHAVERRGGAILTSWLAHNLFGPLALSTMHLPYDQTEYVPRLASGYWHLAGKPRRGIYGLHFSGSGGMVASAADLAHWLRALIAGRGPLDGMLDRLAVPGALADATPVDYARGLAVHRIGAKVLLGHGGSLPGFKNQFLFDRDSGLGVVAFSNREEADTQGIAAAIMAAALDLPPSAPSDAVSPAGAFVDPETGYTLDLARAANGPTAAFNGAELKLYRASDGGWISNRGYLPVRIADAPVDSASIEASVGGAPTRRWQRARADQPRDDIAGTYTNDALAVRHRIVAQGGGLALEYAGGVAPDAPHPLVATAADCWRTTATSSGPWQVKPVLRFRRDGAGRIEGFTLSSNRSRGWWFARS
jgi:CubicO group peptidase (beta-lactamase class C family)